MSLSKKDIINNITAKTLLNKNTSKEFLDFFLDVLKLNLKLKTTKISGFGSFTYNKSKERIGRNPLTLEEHIIKSRFKISFMPSAQVKKLIN